MERRRRSGGGGAGGGGVQSVSDTKQKPIMHLGNSK
jgi:hypothetical protein